MWDATSGRLFAYFVRWGVPEDHADDLLQEVFAVVLDQLHRFDGKNGPGWVFTLARYELLTYRANARRSAPRQEQLDDAIPVDPDAEKHLMGIDLYAVLEAFRATLDPVGAMILDHLGSEDSDEELVAHIEAAAGARLTLSALRGRRMRIREGFAAWLRERGLR